MATFDIIIRNPGGGFNVSLFSATTAGYIKYYNGSTWELKPVKYWTGSAWVQKPLKRWDGSAWVIAHP
jgi:hypothetical protein